MKYCLWILAELAVIAADIPEGTLYNLIYFSITSIAIYSLMLHIILRALHVYVCVFDEISIYIICINIQKNSLSRLKHKIIIMTFFKLKEKIDNYIIKDTTCR